MAIEHLAHARSMTHLIMSYIPARMVYVAAKLALVDHIHEAGVAPQDLARRLELGADALHRIMRVLAGLGILREHEGLFFVTPFGESLRKDAPYSVRDWAIYSHELVYTEFADVIPRIRKAGQPVAQNRLEYLRLNPELEAIYHTAMSKRGRIETAAIAEAYDFSACGTIVDVGGGNGALLSGLLVSNEKVSAVLFDQKSAIEAAKAGRGGPLPRCKFVAGSFFEAVPEGGDIYILKRVLVDWTDEEAIRILQKCRTAMNKGMRLLIIDPLFGPPNEKSPGHLYDMIFLLRIGRVRTEGEYSALLRNTGFRLHRIVPTVSDVSILESFAE